MSTGNFPPSTFGGLQISQYTREKANRARLVLESYYSNLLTQHAERETRFDSFSVLLQN